MNKKIRNLIIIFCLIIIIAIIVIIYSILHLNQEKSDAETKSFEEQDTYQVNNNIIQVQNRNKYFAVEKDLNAYILYLRETNGEVKGAVYDQSNKEAFLKQCQEQGTTIMKKMLAADYISTLNLTDKDLINMAAKYKGTSYDLYIDKMYMLEKTTKINIFIVYAEIGGVESDFIVKTDSGNYTYEIYLEDYMKKNNYSEKMNIQNVTISDNSIEVNDYNKFKYINIDDEYMSTAYLSKLKTAIKNDPEKAYNMLDPQYAKLRFGSLNSFKEYIKGKADYFDSIKLDKYQYNKYDSYSQYVCIDQNGNYYIFNETAIMQASAMLDTYTIVIPQFTEKYKEANEQQKVALNINRFMSAINDENYTFAYSLLADSFKASTFPTQADFENYVKKYFFANNSVEYDKFTSESNEDVYELQVTDKTSASNSKLELTVIMQLQNDTNFVMSFSIK